MLHQNFVIVGTIISSIGTFAYLVDVIKGKVRPNKVSFLLWSIAPFIAFAAQMQQGSGLEALMTFSTGFLPLLIFIASFVNKKSEWKVTRFDLMCGALSLVGLAIWMSTRVGNVAIAFSIVADALAGIPTIVKAYKHPETELAWPWAATGVGTVLTLLTIPSFTFANSAFIIYILLFNIIIFSLTEFKVGKRSL